MESSFFSRVTKAVGSNFVGQIIVFARGILLVPLFLHYWGGVLYGEWLVLSAAISYLALLDIGIQSFVVNRMCQAYVQNRIEDLHRDLHSFLRLFLVIISIGALLLASFLLFFPVDELLKFKVTPQFTASISIVFLGMNILFVSLPIGLVASLYRATGEFARGAMIGNCFSFAILSANTIVLWAGGGMVMFSFSIFSIAGIHGFLVIWDLSRIRPNIKVSLRDGSIRHAIQFIGPSLLFFIISIATLLNIQGTLLVLNFFLGGMAVAPYSTLRALSQFAIQIGSLLSPVIWPELTSLDARGDVDNFKKIWSSYVKINVLSAFCVVIPLRNIAPDLYVLWTGNKLIFDPILLDIFLIQIVLMVFWSGFGMPLLSTNRHRGYSLTMFINAVLTILLSLWFVRIWGINGVAGASLLVDFFFTSPIIIILVSKYFKESASQIIIRFILPGGLIGGAVMFASAWVIPLAGSSIVLMLFMAGILVAIYLVLSYCLWLNDEERGMTVDIFRKLRAYVS